MTIKFSVYNAQTGENTLYDTKEEALQAFWVNVINFAKSHFHNTAYMIVEQNDDGSETWSNDGNKIIDNPKGSQEIEEMMSCATSLENPTKVEVLP